MPRPATPNPAEPRPALPNHAFPRRSKPDHAETYPAGGIEPPRRPSPDDVPLPKQTEPFPAKPFPAMPILAMPILAKYHRTTPSPIILYALHRFRGETPMLGPPIAQPDLCPGDVDPRIDLRPVGDCVFKIQHNFG